MKKGDEIVGSDNEGEEILATSSSQITEKGESPTDTKKNSQTVSEEKEPKRVMPSIEVEKLRDELEAEKKRNEDLVRQMKYLQADILNLQRQSDRMLVDVRNQARSNLIAELISVKEDLERAANALDSSSNGKKGDFADGLMLLVTKIDGVLKREDVSEIPVEEGSRLDPHLHEAVSTRLVEEFEDGAILSTVRKGYTMNGKVLKPALVEVARKKSPPKNEEMKNTGTFEKMEKAKSETKEDVRKKNSDSLGVNDN